MATTSLNVVRVVSSVLYDVHNATTKVNSENFRQAVLSSSLTIAVDSFGISTSLTSVDVATQSFEGQEILKNRTQWRSSNSLYIHH